MHAARASRVSVAIVMALAAIGLSQIDSAPAAANGLPVPHSLQQVFNPGTLTSGSTPVTGYTGDLLQLQAVDVGMTTSEPTIGVMADGTAFMTGATLAVDTDVAWGGAQTHVLRSSDGGITWTSVGLRSSRTQTPIPPANLDPLIWLDPASERLFDVSLLGYCSWINFTDNKGGTWVPNPLGCGTQGFNDHQTIGGGPPREGLETLLDYPNVLYYCVNELIRTQCGRSIDGGITWLPTESEPYPNSDTRCAKIVGHVETDPEGRVLLPNGGCANPHLAISEDNGKNWRRVNVGPAIDSAENHTAVAADAAGNLYYMSLGRIRPPEGQTGPTRYLPLLTISTDHGTTWGDPIMVAPPGVNHANFPEIAAGDEGKIAITFPGATDASIGPRSKWNQYVVITEDALAATPVFLSATANDPLGNPVHRGPCLGRCAGWWDFIDIVVSPDGEAWAAGVDDCIFRCDNPGDGELLHAGRGIAIRQIGGPKLRS